LWDKVEMLRQVLWQGNRLEYEIFWDLYDTVLYLGYVSVLSLLQPLVPTLLFVNNMLEVRTDIIKIGTYQRPVPRTSRDLGEWEKCLWFQNFAAVLQVALFTTVSTETLEKVWFTDSTNAYYYVNGKLTMTVRLSVAFVFSVLMFGAIFIIRASVGEPPAGAVVERQRSRARSMRGLHKAAVKAVRVDKAARVDKATRSRGASIEEGGRIRMVSSESAAGSTAAQLPSSQLPATPLQPGARSVFL